MAKILAVNGSPRKDGSTRKALQNAMDSVGGGDLIDLGDLQISGCRGCNSCKADGECVLNDDMSQIYKKIDECDMLMIASPIYFGAESGLFKNFLDRFNAFIYDHNGTMGASVGKGKKASILLTCGSPDGHMTFQGVAVHLMGVMKALGMNDVSSAILPNASPENVLTTDFFKDYLDALDFQMM